MIVLVVDTSPYHQRKELVLLAHPDGEPTVHDPRKSKAVKLDVQRIKHSVGGGSVDRERKS